MQQGSKAVLIHPSTIELYECNGHLLTMVLADRRSHPIRKESNLKVKGLKNMQQYQTFHHNIQIERMLKPWISRKWESMYLNYSPGVKGIKTAKKLVCSPPKPNVISSWRILPFWGTQDCSMLKSKNPLFHKSFMRKSPYDKELVHRFSSELTK